MKTWVNENCIKMIGYSDNGNARKKYNAIDKDASARHEVTREQ